MDGQTQIDSESEVESIGIIKFGSISDPSGCRIHSYSLIYPYTANGIRYKNYQRPFFLELNRFSPLFLVNLLYIAICRSVQQIDLQSRKIRLFISIFVVYISKNAHQANGQPSIK